MKKQLTVLVLLAASAALLLTCKQSGPASALNADRTETGGSIMPAPEQPAESGAKTVSVAGEYQANRGKIVTITEKMFLAQTNDIYLNPQDYFGKTIKLAGIFKKEYFNDQAYYFVLRYGPGCCGSDGNAGLEVFWNAPKNGEAVYPNDNDWVEAVGVLGTYMEDDYPYLCLDLTSLQKLQTRGAEFVSQ